MTSQTQKHMPLSEYTTLQHLGLNQYCDFKVTEMCVKERLYFLLLPSSKPCLMSRQKRSIAVRKLLGSSSAASKL